MFLSIWAISIVITISWSLTIPHKLTHGIGIWKDKKVGGSIVLWLVVISVVISFFAAMLKTYFIGKAFEPVEAIIYLLLYLLCFALPVSIVIYWSLATSSIIKQSKEIQVQKKILHAVISAVVITLILLLLSLFGYVNMKNMQLKKYIIDQHNAIEDIQVSSYREAYRVSFYVDSDNFDFDDAQKTFEVTRDTLGNRLFLWSVKNSHFLNTTFKMTKFKIQYCDTNKHNNTIYEFYSTRDVDFTNWRVSKSREPEHLDKEYYREIALEPPVSNDVGGGFI